MSLAENSDPNLNYQSEVAWFGTFEVYLLSLNFPASTGDTELDLESYKSFFVEALADFSVAHQVPAEVLRLLEFSEAGVCFITELVRCYCYQEGREMLSSEIAQNSILGIALKVAAKIAVYGVKVREALESVYSGSCTEGEMTDFEFDPNEFEVTQTGELRIRDREIVKALNLRETAQNRGCPATRLFATVLDQVIKAVGPQAKIVEPSRYVLRDGTVL